MARLNFVAALRWSEPAPAPVHAREVTNGEGLQEKHVGVEDQERRVGEIAKDDALQHHTRELKELVVSSDLQ